MKEIIKSIEEVENVKGVISGDKNEGYKITTNKQEIYLLIDSFGQCCEDFGHFVSEDSFDEFIESELLDIKLVDTALNVEAVKEVLPSGLDCGGDIMFVNLETNKGTLQLAVYNSHNGYYGHDVILKSNQINKTYTL